MQVHTLTVPALVAMWGIVTCVLCQVYTNDIAWAAIVVLVAIVDIIGRSDIYIYVLFLKIVSGMLHTRMVPDFVAYPLDVIYMLMATGIMYKKRSRRSRHIALMCTAISCIVVSKHSNIASQPIHVVACRLLLYVACVIYSMAEQWEAVARSMWILHVQQWVLPVALVQLYMYGTRVSRTHIAPPVERTKQSSVVWTAQGPMAV